MKQVRNISHGTRMYTDLESDRSATIKSIAGDSKGINPQGPIIHLGRVRHSAASSTGLGCSRVEGPVLCRDAVTDFRYGILETS